MAEKKHTFRKELRRVFKGTLKRAYRNSWRSAWTCLKTGGLNFGVRLCNRFCRVHRVLCPCCGWKGYRFLYWDCGEFTIPDAACPHCLGHERHRMMHLLLTRRPPEFMGQQRPGRVLHLAPEPQVRNFVDQNPVLTTIGADYSRKVCSYAPKPCIRGDIHALPFADGTFSGLYCLHVLEHVKDDRAALRELSRILSADGQAVIMVPFMMDQTETIEYGAPRPDMFDHVRGYSPLDFRDRLDPFSYEEVLPETFLSPKEARQFRIPKSQAIYICRKRGFDTAEH